MLQIYIKNGEKIPKVFGEELADFAGLSIKIREICGPIRGSI